MAGRRGRRHPVPPGTGGASADLTDIVVTTDTGERVELPDIAYRGNGPVTTGLAIEADSYTVDMTVTYHEGMWGVQVHTGDVNGPDHNVASFGRSFELQLVREGCGSTLAGTEVSMDMVRPGTVWHARIHVADRGADMALEIDGLGRRGDLSARRQRDGRSRVRGPVAGP